MGKTTIDGLAVRESSNSRRRVSSASAGKSMDMALVKKSTKPARASSARRDNSLPASTRRRSTTKVSSESFLEPVQSFGYDARDDYDFTSDYDKELDTAFGGSATTADSGADWSDLLGELSSETATDKVGANEFVQPATSGRWLDDWAEKSKDDFLADDFSDKRDAQEEQSVLDKFVDDEEDSGKKPKKHKKKFSVGKVIALAVVLILVLGGGALYMWGDGLISRLTGGKSGLFDSLMAMVSDEIPFETDKNGRTNVLIFGTEGYDMDGTAGDGGTHDGTQLTDSIMVASFDQETKDVALLSLPRDLKVPMACSAGKINEVFWCHNQSGTNEEAGAEALMKQIGDILGIEFQYYAHVNWASLVKIVDTLGGITVTLDEDINDYYYTGMVAKAGEPITLNGEQAVGLARARHGTTGGDFTRGNTQQKIVEGIAQKVLQTGVGVNEALGLLNILGDNLRSNFSADNIKAAVRLASGFNISSIRQVPLVNYDKNIFYVTTATINNISYVVPSAGERDYSEIQEYVAGMFSSDGVKREGATFAVYNATDGYGVASAEKDRLEADGFKVLRVGDATSGVCETKYCVYEMSNEKVATRAALEERYGLVVRPESELPEGVWGGDVDFVVIVGLVDEESQ